MSAGPKPCGSIADLISGLADDCVGGMRTPPYLPAQTALADTKAANPVSGVFSRPVAEESTGSAEWIHAKPDRS
jgi:hypothetical protein